MSEKPEKINVSRRKFLQGAAGMAMVGASAYGALKYDTISDVIRDDTGTFEKDPATQKAKEFLSKEYGITVLAGPNWDITVLGDRISQIEYIQSLAQVLEVASKYPPLVLRNKSITMHVVNDLQRVDFSAKSWKELWNRTSYGATTKPFGDIILDAKRIRKHNSTIDHELYHSLEYLERGFTANDPEWIRMHQEVCQCNPYGRDAVPANELEKSINLAAFSPYGKTQPVEDRATWAQFLMDPKTHTDYFRSHDIPDEQYAAWLAKNGIAATVEDAAKTKLVVRKKYDAILADYEKWSNGAMNEAYWEKLRTGRIRPSSEIVELLKGLSLSIRKIRASDAKKHKG